MAKKFFVVTAGRKPGVYTSWLDAAPHVIGVTGAIFAGYDSETEAFRAYGKAGMAGERCVLGADDPDETPSQSTVRVREPQRRHQGVSAANRVKAEIKGDESVEEIVVQCPPVVGSRPRPTIQRTSTLPARHTPRSPAPTDTVQRSKTAPDLDSRPMPSTPKKSVHGQKSQASNVDRSRAISISTNGSATEESIPPSPATNVSMTLSPALDHLPLSPPRETTSCRSSPARRGDRGDRDQHSRRSSTAPRSARGGKNQKHGIAASPCRKSGNTTGDSARNAPRQGTSRPHQSSKKSQLRDRPPTQGGLHRTKSHISRDRSRSRTPPSPGGSSNLTYVSDDERPEGGLTQSTGNSDYYTPSSRNSEVSDAESEPPERAPSSTLKRKGKHRASPPPSSFPRSSPFSPAGSSPRDLNSGNIPTPKKRRDRYTRSPGPSNCGNHRETPGQTPGQDPSQSLAQDFCHCAGPCPSCNMPRFPFPPYYHPLMFQSIPYQHLYLPPPHVHTGYPPPHYGPPSYPYPHMISQPIEPLPSISSAQPIPSFPGYLLPPPPATHPPIAHPPNAPSHVSLVPVPVPSTPAPEPSASAPVPPPPVSVGSPPVDPPASQPMSSEILGALGQFTQPPQRSVTVIDPSCDPRSPYANPAVVPAFPNTSIILGRPGTPGLSPLEGLGLTLSSPLVV